MGFITKGRGSTRKVVPIRDSKAVSNTKAVPTMTFDDLAHLLIEIMDESDREEYVHYRLSTLLDDDKAYYSKMSKLYDEQDKDELAYIIIDNMKGNEFFEFAIKFKVEQLNADRSYYMSALERFSKRKR